MVLVITADDFGLEPSVNAAISAALASGWVTHASLLANTVHAEEACELARKHGAADRIGLHFNLSEGVPLTSAMSASKTFCSDGRFLPVENFPRYASLNAVDREAVAAELRAQFDAIRRFGIRPSHLDSHNDVHVAPSIARIVADVARDTGLSRVRISRNCGRRQGVVRRFQHRAYNLCGSAAAVCAASTTAAPPTTCRARRSPAAALAGPRRSHDAPAARPVRRDLRRPDDAPDAGSGGAPARAHAWDDLTPGAPGAHTSHTETPTK